MCKEVTRLRNKQNKTGKISEVTQEAFYTSLDKKSRKTLLSVCCSSPLLSARQDIYCMEEGRAYATVHISFMHVLRYTMYAYIHTYIPGNTNNIIKLYYN